MKKWFEMFVPRMTCFIDGEGAPAPTGGGDATPAAVVDPAPVADPAATPAPDAQADPNDPLAGLMGDLDKLIEPDPQADPNAPPATLPQEFLSISPFVTDAQTMQQAVRAADEVWKVATGEANAASLLEGIRTANPERFNSVVGELTQYLEQVTGKKFGGDGQPADPVAQLRNEIAQQRAQEQAERAQAAYQQQVAQAATVAKSTVAEALKGTFAEGHEAYILARCAEKVGIPEQQMVNELLRGNKAPLQAAIKAVKNDEVKRLKAYNENLIKSRKALSNSVPATKNTPATSTLNASAMRPGESRTEYAVRLWNESSTNAQK